MITEDQENKTTQDVYYRCEVESSGDNKSVTTTLQHAGLLNI